jgi:UDP-N-acetylglucosamine 2-epimerase (non-hydrolysing)
VAYPVHRNPNILGPVTERLAGSGVVLIEPLEYPAMVDLMARAFLLLTDSGGIQEEAPSLRKPVLVLRETTERPEAVEAGTVKLVGTDPDRIMGEASRLLDDDAAYQQMSRTHNPYGDGAAGQRIARILADFERDGY